MKTDPRKSKVLGLSNYKNIVAVYWDEGDSVSLRFGIKRKTFVVGHVKLEEHIRNSSKQINK